MAGTNVQSFQAPLTPSAGGLGVINNDSSTITISGSFPATFTFTGPTSVTFPTSGTLATTAALAPAGTDNNIQFNLSGVFAANANFNYDNSNGNFTLPGFTWTGSPQTLALSSAADQIALTLSSTNSATNTAETFINIHAGQSGAAAANFGAIIRVGLKSTTTADRDASQLITSWSTATDASRTSQFLVQLVNNAGAIGTTATFAGNGNLTLTGGLSATTGAFTGTVLATAATSSLTLGANSGNIGLMQINGSTSGTVSLTVAAAAGTWTLTLPTSAGSANQFLQTDGSGVTTWATNGAQLSATTSQFDKTNATAQDVPGLTSNVVSGGTYLFRAVLQTQCGAGGAQVGINGTATATSIAWSAVAYINGTGSVSAGQNLGLGSLSFTTQPLMCVIEGCIVVNASGTLTVRFAQASASGTSSVLVNSTFSVTKIG